MQGRKVMGLAAAALLASTAIPPQVAGVVAGQRAEVREAQAKQNDQSKRGNQDQQCSSVDKMMRLLGHGAGYRHSYPRGGWSVAEGKRCARKARNVKRNRRAHRG